MTKQELYSQIDDLKIHLGVTSPPPYDAKKLCIDSFKLNLDAIPLKTSKLRGMSHIPSRSVVIDCNRSADEQNFFCMHEIMHHVFHRGRSTKIYSSYEETPADQNSFVEWQANEGAAQFLLPYQIFIPDYVALSQQYARENFASLAVLDILADRYFVSPKVVSNRIDSLNYEIYQYLRGTPISSIKILSKAALKRKGFNRSHTSLYCRSCLSPISLKEKYCHVCGSVLEDGSKLHRMNYTGTGAGFMIYSKVELRNDSRVAMCPNCKNEEHLSDAIHCIICGKPAVNQCTGAFDDYHPCDHTEPLPGNARYCPYCGCETTFLQEGLLPKWQDDDCWKDTKSSSWIEVDVLDDDSGLPF